MRRQILLFAGFLLIVFLVFGLTIRSILQSGNRGDDQPKILAESVVAYKTSDPNAQFVKGDVIVKFRSGSTPIKATTTTRQESSSLTLTMEGSAYQNIDQSTIPQVIKSINSKFPVQKIGKVIPGVADPETELQKIRTQFSSEIANGTRYIVDGALQSVDLSTVYKVTFAADAPVKDLLRDLRKDPSVAYAEPNYIATVRSIPNDPAFRNQWALHNTGQSGALADADIDAPEAWDITQGSSSVVIAILDTGVSKHRDLGGCIGPGCKIIDGYNAVNGGTNVVDYTHGTHVAGIAGAIAGNAKGISGVCPKCSLMAIKISRDNGGIYMTDAINGIQYAVNKGAKILNNSWGTNGYSQALQDTINWAAAQGVIVVAAAANSPQGSSQDYPANMENVVAVAGTTNRDVKAPYSSFGNFVDISAPAGELSSTGCSTPLAVSILSTVAAACRYQASDCRIEETVDGTCQVYEGKSGNSMATPMVSGVIGLIMSQYPAWIPSMVIDKLKSSADPLPGEPLFAQQLLGAGRLNAFRAVTVPTPIPPSCSQPACDVACGYSCPGGNDGGQCVSGSCQCIPCADNPPTPTTGEEPPDYYNERER